MSEDERYLRVLSVFHYVVGGIGGVFACIPIIHLVIGVLMVTGVMDGESGKGPPAIVGWVFILIGGAMITAGWSFAVCMILAGRCLWKRKWYTFCLVMAAIACTFMPFGTVLGVFTIIVLSRPTVKALFEAKETTG